LRRALGSQTSCLNYGTTSVTSGGYERTGGDHHHCLLGPLEYLNDTITFAADEPRRGRRTDCRAKHCCLFSSCLRRRWVQRPNRRGSSNPPVDQRSPIHCPGCTTTLRSKSFSRPCPRADNSLHDPIRFLRPAVHSGVPEFQLARPVTRGSRSLADLLSQQHTAPRTNACDPCW